VLWFAEHCAKREGWQLQITIRGADIRPVGGMGLRATAGYGQIVTRNGPAAASSGASRRAGPACAENWKRQGKPFNAQFADG